MMKRILIAMSLAAACFLSVGTAEASKTFSRGLIIGYREYAPVYTHYPRTEFSRGFYGYGYGRVMGGDYGRSSGSGSGFAQ